MQTRRLEAFALVLVAAKDPELPAIDLCAQWSGPECWQYNPTKATQIQVDYHEQRVSHVPINSLLDAYVRPRWRTNACHIAECECTKRYNSPTVRLFNTSRGSTSFSNRQLCLLPRFFIFFFVLFQKNGQQPNSKRRNRIFFCEKHQKKNYRFMQMLIPSFSFLSDGIDETKCPSLPAAFKTQQSQHLCVFRSEIMRIRNGNDDLVAMRKSIAYDLGDFHQWSWFLMPNKYWIPDIIIFHQWVFPDG